MNQASLHKLSCGLYLISSQYDGKSSGCIANTLQQVTSSPVQLSITLNKNNYTEQLIEQSGTFNAVVLSQNVDMDVIRHFGFQSGKDIEKYETQDHKVDGCNIPYIQQHAVAYFTCKVVSKLDVGTHVIFVGEVVEMEVLNEEEVMTYAYYNKVKNGSTPKNASSYQEKAEKSGWRCTVCGYIYEGEVLPEDFICPLCGVPASFFEKV